MLKHAITVLLMLSLFAIYNTGSYCPRNPAEAAHKSIYQAVVPAMETEGHTEEVIKPTPKALITASETGRPTFIANKPVKSTEKPLNTDESGSAEKATSSKKPVEINGLIELPKIDNTFVLDIKYATDDNFTGKKIYTKAMCIINKDTARKLIKANEEFKKKGLKIKVFDAYRPYSAQKVLWDAASDKSFVASPKKGSIHNRGAAVDITLVDKNGVDLEMPSAYDEFSKRARLDYTGCSQNKLNNRELLGKTMVKYGFKRISNEWWHFEDTNAKSYQIQDIAFESFG